MYAMLATLLTYRQHVLIDLAIAIDATAFQPKLLYVAKQVVVICLALTRGFV